MNLTAASHLYQRLSRLPGHRIEASHPVWTVSAVESFWAPDYWAHVTWNLSGDVIVEVDRNGFGAQPTFGEPEMRSVHSESTSCVTRGAAMRAIRAKASYSAWRKFLYRHGGWSRARYNRIHDYEVRRNGKCGAVCCDRCSGHA